MLLVCLMYMIVVVEGGFSMALGLRLFNYRYIWAPLECQWRIKRGVKKLMWKILELGQERWEDKIFIWTCVWLETMWDFELMCGWDQIDILYWIWPTDALGAFFNKPFLLNYKILSGIFFKLVIYILNFKSTEYYLLFNS